jgi:hypothetical protein
VGWCKIANVTFLVACSSLGFQIFEEEGSQVVFTYSFKDDDNADNWEYASSVASTSSYIFVGNCHTASFLVIKTFRFHVPAVTSQV